MSIVENAYDQEIRELKSDLFTANDGVRRYREEAKDYSACIEKVQEEIKHLRNAIKWMAVELTYHVASPAFTDLMDSELEELYKAVDTLEKEAEV